MLKQKPKRQLNKWVGALATSSFPLVLALTPLPSFAQTALQCTVDFKEGPTLSNTASYNYQVNENSSLNISGLTNTLENTTTITDSDVSLKSSIQDNQGNLIFGVGTIIDGVKEELSSQFFSGLSQDDRDKVVNTLVVQFLTLEDATPLGEAVTKLLDSITVALPEDQKSLVNQVSRDRLLIAFSATSLNNLQLFGLNPSAATTARNQALTKISNFNDGSSFGQVRQDLFQAAINGLDQTLKDTVTTNFNKLETELNLVRTGNQTTVNSGNTVTYQFVFENKGVSQAGLTLPSVAQLQESGLKGPGKITAATYQKIKISNNTVITEGTLASNGTQVILNSGEQVKILATVEIPQLPPISSQSVSVGLTANCGKPLVAEPTLNLVTVLDPLTDPFGQITGCGGELLADYRGFSVSMYDVDPVIPTEVSALTPLTATELPDNPNNNIPKGIAPNTQNSNPFFLANQDNGKYSFLFDQARGQLDKGRNFILIVKPPIDSIYDDRRVKITIGDKVGNVVNYTARSLDGKPISIADPLLRTELQGQIVFVEDAERVGLDIGVLDLGTSICQAQEIRIDKTGDRSTAQPGDTVIYRLVIRNLSVTSINNLTVRDVLPVGFKFYPNSVRAAIGDTAINLNVSQDRNNVTFTYPDNVDSGATITVVYAAQVTPDAMRGTGKNLASVNATRSDNGLPLADGPVDHILSIQAGILSNYGIITGSVFVDRNFDGMQQGDEPGIPNAIIFLDNGNRVVTDKDGVFSVANILPGTHTGVIDLSSIPGYGLAPNLKFIEQNSQSRLVRLAPGGVVRMNFGMTPAFGEEIKP